MKIFKICFLTFLIGVTIHGQEVQEISRYWTSFEQTIEIKNNSPKKYKLDVAIKLISADTLSSVGIWAEVKSDSEEGGSFKPKRNIKGDSWQVYEIEGVLDEKARSLNFGAYCLGNGFFYFDDFQLTIENEKGKMIPFEILNASFEKPFKNNIPNWQIDEVKDTRNFRVKEFERQGSSEAYNGKQSLLIVGKDVQLPDDRIMKKDSDNPLIESMISMLEDLKERVISQTQTLNTYELDHLHDEEANRIGALIMHLAAAEAFYQVFTFEGREFNKEEEEEWMIALELGKKAQKKYQGKPISHYIDIYQKVRDKTIEELRKRDDAWFKEIQPAYQWSNNYCWFHVMEHQSSHLGQILFLKKRIPPEGHIKLQPEIKD